MSKWLCSKFDINDGSICQSKTSTVGTVLTTEVAVNFENFFEGVLAVN